MPVGKIIKGVGGLYSVIDGEWLYLCSAKGIFRKDGITPLPGDEVRYEPDSLQQGYGSIHEIFERRSALVRPPVSNVDQLLIVVTLNAPPPDLLLVEKLILSALTNNITPILCINKSDLPMDDVLLEEMRGFEQAGFETVYTSVNETSAKERLVKILTGKTTILAGQSGVGKSTLFNALLARDHMEVGNMSRRIARGKHTTRHVELVRLVCGGYLVDSPGFSAFEFKVENYRELDLCYPEFAPYLGDCRFKECSHIHEPECAVLEARRAGKLHDGRYRRYIELYRTYQTAHKKRYRH